MNRARLDERLARADDLLKAHAGGVELESVSKDGDVVVRFTGMCTGCRYKPVTMVTIVRKQLMQVPGVRSVEAVGSRISEEAQQRLAHFMRNETGLFPQARQAP